MSESLDVLLDEYDTLSRAIEHTESFLEFYNVESMTGNELAMAQHYLDTVMAPVGLSFVSFEDSSTPASDAAMADQATKGDGESRGEKLKKFATKSLDSMKERLKKLPAEIKKYTEILLNAITGSTKGLTNSARQILDQLESAESSTKSVTGKYSIFSDTRPHASIQALAKGISSLSQESEKAVKQIIGDAGGVQSNLKLYNYKGTEFNFDGTSKFFDSKVKNESTDIAALSKSDIKLVCDAIIDVASKIESLKDNLPEMSRYIDPIVDSSFKGASVASAAGNGVKDGSKKAMAVASFYRNVIGGYIKYTIKISKAALGLANGSIKG